MGDIKQESFLDLKWYIIGWRWYQLRNIAQCGPKKNYFWDIISGDVSRQISVEAILRPIPPMVFFAQSLNKNKLGNIQVMQSCDSCWVT